MKQPKDLPVIKCYDDNIADIIQEEIGKYGNKCSLNHLDVSDVTDMTHLFYFLNFNGDISEWDMRKVKYTTNMFYHSKFNGNISKWYFKHVINSWGMFAFSNFNGDISTWQPNKKNIMNYMFQNCPL